MNVELLRKVKAAILEEPLRMNMDFWLDYDYRAKPSRAGSGPKCGTVGCISGWATVIEARKEKRGRTTRAAGKLLAYSYEFGFDEGRRALGLTIEQAGNLFYDSSWPEDLSLRALDPQTPKYAAAVARAIDAFIACDGDWTRYRPEESK